MEKRTRETGTDSDRAFVQKGIGQLARTYRPALTSLPLAPKERPVFKGRSGHIPWSGTPAHPLPTTCDLQLKKRCIFTPVVRDGSSFLCCRTLLDGLVRRFWIWLREEKRTYLGQMSVILGLPGAIAVDQESDTC